MIESEHQITRLSIDIVVKIAIMAVLIWWSLSIISPFILMLIWAAILAVALFPLHKKLCNVVPKQGLSASIIAIILIAILIVPVILFGNSTFDSVHQLSQKVSSGGLVIPEPSENVKSWPLVGERIYLLWIDFQQHTQVFMEQYKAEIAQLFKRIIGAAAGTLGSLLMFVVSLIIAAIFMANSASINRGCRQLINRLMTQNAERTQKTMVLTIRSVATGVLGVALIQAVLAGIGMIIAGVPGAGIISLIVMIMTIAQLPTLLIMGPVAAYYFTIADTTPALIFMVFAIIVSFADVALKPIFLGRGMDIPMPVILLGAIGGLIMFGIIGLFVGAVILALTYELMLDWLNANETSEAQQETE